MEDKIFCLKHFDTVLLKFKAVSFNQVEIIQISDEYQSLIPFGLTLDNHHLFNWLKHRNIPKNRIYVDTFLSKCGLSINRPLDVISISKGLSLNDCYWITEDEFDGKFSEYNLYDNKFNNILGLIAFTGYGSSQIRSSLKTCPEFTTNGMLPKCWHRDKGIYLYKGGTSGASNLGFEPYSEYYAWQIANAMGLNAVEYKLTKELNKTLCSKCLCFSDKERSFVSLAMIDEIQDFQTMIEFYQKLGEQYLEKLFDMLLFDAIIYNTDRHFGNFGFMVDSHTNQIIDVAPIFDNGNSLFNMASLSVFESIEELDEYRQALHPLMYYDYLEVLKGHLSKRQIENVRKLINFRFVRHSRYNLEPKRLKLIEKIIQKRIVEILNIG